MLVLVAVRTASSRSTPEHGGQLAPPVAVRRGPRRRGRRPPRAAAGPGRPGSGAACRRRARRAGTRAAAERVAARPAARRPGRRAGGSSRAKRDRAVGRDAGRRRPRPRRPSTSGVERPVEQRPAVVARAIALSRRPGGLPPPPASTTAEKPGTVPATRASSHRRRSRWQAGRVTDQLVRGARPARLRPRPGRQPCARCDELTPSDADLVVLPGGVRARLRRRRLGRGRLRRADGRAVRRRGRAGVADARARRSSPACSRPATTRRGPSTPWSSAAPSTASYRKIHLYDSFGYRESDRLAPGPAGAGRGRTSAASGSG